MSNERTILQQAFDCGVKRTKKQISQIKEIRDIVERIRKQKETREVEIEIYRLLQEAKTPSQQEKVLEAYIKGLEEADKQGRLEYEIVWSRNKKDVEGNNIWEVILNQENSQIIVTTFAEKPRNVYCYDLKTGKRNWVYEVRYEQAWTPVLGKDIFFFIPMKNHDSPSWSGDYVHAISLKTGELLWKAKPDGDHESAEKIVALFNDLLLVESFKGLSALNIIDNGKEEWSCRGSVKSGIKIDETFLLITGERKIGWFSKDGKLLQEEQFAGFKDEGFINFMEQDEANFYISVWYIGSRYDKKVDDFVKEKERSFIYCLDKAERKIKWQFEVIGTHFNKVISQGKKLYIIGEDKCLVADKAQGKVIDELDCNGKTVRNGLLFCTGPEDKDDDSFDFYAIDLLSKKVKWQRKNFSFLALHQDLLYGRVENALVVLNQNNGKERVKIQMPGSIHKIQFIDGRHLLVHSNSFICLIKQK